MTFSDKEKWILILLIFKTTQTGKNMPMKMKQAVCEFLRNKICPTINYDQWLQIEKDINKTKTEVMDLMYEGMKVATSSSKLPPEVQKMFSEADLGELDTKVKGELSKIDFGKLKKVLDKLPKETRKELEPMFENIETLAGEYAMEKKD